MNNVKFELIAAPSYTMFTLANLPAITTAGTGHSVNDIVTFNGNGVGSGIKIKLTTVDGSGGVTGYTWHSGGLGFASNEVATQGNGSATWSSSATSAQPGYSRLEWFTTQGPLAERGPVAFEGDKIVMSLTVPERQSSKSIISRSVISHNTES